MTDRKMPVQKKLYISSTTISLLYLIEFFGLWALILESMCVTSIALPILLSAASVLPLIFSVLNIVFFHRNGISVAAICVALAMALAYFLFAAYAISKLTFVLISALPVLAAAGIVGLFLFLILVYPKLGKTGKIASAAALSVVILCVCIFGIFGLVGFRFTSDGTVFAVNDEYQIAWSTSVKSVGSVTVNGVTYYDESNGRNRVSELHKVSVPMSELDAAGSYTIRSTPVYSEAAYLSVTGKERSVEHNFRPVDASDGLQMYNISDNHERLSGAAAAGNYFGDKLDLLLLNGDIINDVSSMWQISLIYRLANDITGGERPVIFTRGNHECIGKYADELPQYVGSSDGKLYYTVELGNAFFLVIDTALDKKDDNDLFKPASNFEIQRKKQAEWLDGLTDLGDDSEYRFVLAHMAYALSEHSRFPEFADKIVEVTNDKFDLCISGHVHILEFEQTGTKASTSYPVIRGSHCSNRLEEGEGVSLGEFTGTAIECVNGKITASFTNAKGEVLKTMTVK